MKSGIDRILHKMIQCFFTDAEKATEHVLMYTEGYKSRNQPLLLIHIHLLQEVVFGVCFLKSRINRHPWNKPVYHTMY